MPATQRPNSNGKIADGGNPAEDRRALQKASTLRDAFEHFLPLPTRGRGDKRPKAERTKKEYRLQFEAYLKPWENRRFYPRSVAAMSRRFTMS
jgi:hypothetical protein